MDTLVLWWSSLYVDLRDLTRLHSVDTRWLVSHTMVLCSDSSLATCCVWSASIWLTHSDHLDSSMCSHSWYFYSNSVSLTTASCSNFCKFVWCCSFWARIIFSYWIHYCHSSCVISTLVSTVSSTCQHSSRMRAYLSRSTNHCYFVYSSRSRLCNSSALSLSTDFVCCTSAIHVHILVSSRVFSRSASSELCSVLVPQVVKVLRLP